MEENESEGYWGDWETTYVQIDTLSYPCTGRRIDSWPYKYIFHAIVLVDEAVALLPPNKLLLFIVAEIEFMSKVSFLKLVKLEPIKHFSLLEASS